MDRACSTYVGKVKCTKVFNNKIVWFYTPRINGGIKIQKILNRMGEDGLYVAGFRQRLVAGFFHAVMNFPPSFSTKNFFTL